MSSKAIKTFAKLVLNKFKELDYKCDFVHIPKLH